jgi:AraC-like DNA-binding protein
MRLEGVNYRRVDARAPFGLRFETPLGRAQFHFIAHGTALLRYDGATVLPLGCGDAIFLPRGGAHDLVSAPDEPSCSVDRFKTETLCGNVDVTSACPAGDPDGQSVLVFSACMNFDLGGMRPLIALMPEVMRVDTLLARQPEIEPMLKAMERETCAPRAGSVGIMARLADVLAASIVRGWVECGGDNAAGWFEALRDPRLGRAIGALHRTPGRNWTVAELAAEAGCSRSMFAERFQSMTGQSPLRYLAELRMRLATQWIEHERQPIDMIAQRLGYASQAAFSRAFKRITGQSPGMVRQAAGSRPVVR